MVIDKIENYKIYNNLSERIAKAFEYINTTDLLETPSGRYDIDGDNVFALVQEYDTKDVKEGKLEKHTKYIDLQYIISGEEFMGVRLFNNETLISKNEDEDYAFYEGDSSLNRFNAGMFALFFPNDLHMPCIRIDGPSKVKKLVVKIRA